MSGIAGTIAELHRLIELQEKWQHAQSQQQAPLAAKRFGCLVGVLAFLLLLFVGGIVAVGVMGEGPEAVLSAFAVRRTWAENWVEGEGLRSRRMETG